MKGLFFIENFIAGGADTMARILVNNMRFANIDIMVNKNHDTSILLGGELPTNVNVINYRLITIPELLSLSKYFNNKLLNIPLWFLTRLLSYPLFFISILYFLILIIRSKPDIFIANNGGYPAAYYCRSATIAASLLSGIKIFHIVHSMATISSWALIPIEYLIDRLIDTRSKLITVSHATADRLRDVRWIKQKPIVIYNGIPDISLANINNTPVFRILSVGYFDNNKNQSLLIKAVHEIKSRGISEFQVDFLGKETELHGLELCKNIVLEYELEKNVKFHGFMGNITDWYLKCDVYVLTSKLEGLPVSIIEAMRSAKPIIATNVGGIKELVDNNKNGYLIDSNNSEVLAEKLNYLMMNKKVCSDLGRNSRLRYEKYFMQENMVNEYERTVGIFQ